MAVTPREYTISYGSQVIGATLAGGSRTILDGLHTLRESPEDFEVSFSFVLVNEAKNESSYASDIVTLEGNLSLIRQDCKVIYNPSTGSAVNVFAKLFSDNTALNTRCEIEKTEEAASGWSRHYTVTMSGDLPASENVGLRDFSFTVDYDQSRRRTLTVTGNYTPVVSSTARAQYTANVEARIDTVTTLITGDWPDADHPATEVESTDDTNQVTTFTRTYKELLVGESTSTSTLDHPDIGDQFFTIALKTLSAESNPNDPASVPGQLEAKYKGWINAETKKGVSQLKTLYKNTILPWILKNMNDVKAGGVVGFTDATVTYNTADNIIEANLVGVAVSGSQFISRTVKVTTDINFGRIIRRVTEIVPQKTALGVPKSFVFQGEKIVRQTVVTTTTYRNSPAGTNVLIPTADKLGQFSGGSVSFKSKKVQLMARKFEQEQKQTQIAGVGNKVRVTDSIVTEVFELIDGI